MGMFMASVAFRPEPQTDWAVIKPQIESMFKGLEGLTDNLDSDGPGYAIVSPYGDMGMFLAELPGKISALTGGWAVFASCNDSDFDLLELYHNGQLLDKCYVGECFEDYFEEFDEEVGYGKPALEKWLPLLLDAGQRPELEQALGGVDVFAEENLRLLSELTGLPIFDDGLMLAVE